MKPTALDHPSASVSMVMPVLNGMPWLPEAVDSVLMQPGPLELIIVDGGSTDGSRQWLEEIIDGRARLVFEADSGQAEALVRGFRLARGTLLGWLNADDVLHDGALAVIRRAFAEHAAAVLVSGSCDLIDGDSRVVGRIPLPREASFRALLRNPTNLPQPATFFTRSAYESVGGFNPQLHYAMDVDLWLKLAQVGRVVLLPDDVLASFRLHRDAKTARAATEMIREDLSVRRRHGLSTFTRTNWLLFSSGYVAPLKKRVSLAARRWRPTR